MQIQNLSAPELHAHARVLAQLPPEFAGCETLHQSCQERQRTQVYLAQEQLVLDYVSGMPLLVIYEGNTQRTYYLDRLVLLLPGTRFSVAALSGTCAVDFRLRDAQSLLALAEEQTQKAESSPPRLQFERMYTVFYQECASDFYFRGERHEAYELVYVDRGQLHNLVGGKDVVLKQQQLMLIDRNDWHTQYSDLPVNFLTVSFRLRGDALTPLTGRMLQPGQRQLSLIRQLLSDERSQPYAHEYAEALLQQLLISLLRAQTLPAQISGSQLPATSHTEHQIVDRLVQAISMNVSRKLTLQQLADAAHISIPYLHRLFQTQLGMPPGKYIAKIRMEECKALLRDGSLSMGEIAEKMGYSSPQYFSRQFRSVCGMTPSEYVRSLR